MNDIVSIRISIQYLPVYSAYRGGFFLLPLIFCFLLSIYTVHGQSFDGKAMLEPQEQLLKLTPIPVPPHGGGYYHDIDEWLLLLTGGISHTDNLGVEIGVGGGYFRDRNAYVFTEHVVGILSVEATSLNGSFALAPRLSFWTSYPLAMLVVGVGAGYYSNFEEHGLMIQPEVGLDLTIIRFTWRFDIPVGSDSPWKPASGINMKVLLRSDNL